MPTIVERALALVRRVAETREAETASDHELYLLLLQRAADPEPGDEETLLELLGRLEISPEQLQADAEIVGQAVKLTAAAEWSDSQEQERADAGEALAEFRRETERLAAERATEDRKLESAAVSQRFARQAVDQARERLENLRRQHPALFCQEAIRREPSPRPRSTGAQPDKVSEAEQRGQPARRGNLNGYAIRPGGPPRE